MPGRGDLTVGDGGPGSTTATRAAISDRAFVATAPADTIRRRPGCPAPPGDRSTGRSDRDVRGGCDDQRRGRRPGRRAPALAVGRPSPGGRRPAAPSGAGQDRRTAEQAVEHYANHIANTVGSAFMYMTTSGVFREVDCQAFKRYRDNLIARCGSPGDPIEVMLIEQLALAHLNIGRLHFRSATADGLEGARVYGALAIGLTGELRRTALALQDYREKSRAIEAGPSQAATSPADGPGAADDREGADTEQGSKRGRR